MNSHRALSSIIIFCIYEIKMQLILQNLLQRILLYHLPTRLFRHLAIHTYCAPITIPGSQDCPTIAFEMPPIPFAFAVVLFCFFNMCSCHATGQMDELSKVVWNKNWSSPGHAEIVEWIQATLSQLAHPPSFSSLEILRLPFSYMYFIPLVSLSFLAHHISIRVFSPHISFVSPWPNLGCENLRSQLHF